MGSEIPHRHYTYYTRNDKAGYDFYSPPSEDLKFEVQLLDESSRISAFAEYFLGTAPPESVESSTWRNYVVSTINESFIAEENEPQPEPLDDSDKLLDGNLF